MSNKNHPLKHLFTYKPHNDSNVLQKPLNNFKVDRSKSFYVGDAAGREAGWQTGWHGKKNSFENHILETPKKSFCFVSSVYEHNLSKEMCFREEERLFLQRPAASPKPENDIPNTWRGVSGSLPHLQVQAPLLPATCLLSFSDRASHHFDHYSPIPYPDGWHPGIWLFSVTFWFKTHYIFRDLASLW